VANSAENQPPHHTQRDPCSERTRYVRTNTETKINHVHDQHPTLSGASRHPRCHLLLSEINHTDPAPSLVIQHDRTIEAAK
jgi:hypothetical protein